MIRSRHRSLASAMGWSGFASTLTYVSTIVGNILIARALGPSTLGSVTYVVWLLGVVSQLAPLGIPYATQVYVGARVASGDEKAAHQVYWRGVRLVALLGLLSALAWLALARQVLPSEWGWVYVAVTVLLLLASPLHSVMSARAAGELNYRLIGRIENISSVGWLFLAAATCGTRAPIAALAAYAARQLIPTMAWLLLARQLRQIGPSAEPACAPAEQRPFTRLAAEHWLMIAVTAIIWGRAEVGLVTWLANTAEVGFFAVASQLAAPVSMATSLFTAPLAMFAVRSRSQGQQRRLAATGGGSARVFSLISGLAALGIVGLAPVLLGPLYGEAFRAAEAAVPWLAASGLAYALISVFSALSQGIERPAYPLAAMAASVPIFAALSWWLIPPLGAQGAALAQVGSRLVSLIVIWLLVQRRIPELVAWREMACLTLAFLPALTGVGLVSGLHRLGLTLLALAVGLGWVWAVVRRGRFLRPEDHTAIASVLNRLPPSLKEIIWRLWTLLIGDQATANRQRPADLTEDAPAGTGAPIGGPP